MPPLTVAEPTGCYLSFEERAEIALLRAKQVGSGRSHEGSAAIPRTISRELRRNAATRSGKQEYRGTGGAVDGAASGQAPEGSEDRDQRPVA